MTLPVIGVLPTLTVPGIASLAESDQALAQTCLPVDEALEQEWDTDAYFTTYTIQKEHQWPRLHKDIFPELKQNGIPPKTRLLVFDYDKPDHEPWNEDENLEFPDLLDSTVNQNDLLKNWCCYYTTRAGGRILYLLDDYIESEESEQQWLWLASKIRLSGLDVDTATTDWTRLFRLPFVLRDGKETINSAIYESNWDRTIKVSDLGKIAGSSTKPKQLIPNLSYRKPIPSPTPEQCTELLFRVASNGQKPQTERYKQAKKKIQGRECYPCIFEHQVMAHEGSRDTTLHRYVGQAISLLVSTAQTTPEKVYALFLDAVMQLEPDKGTPDWTEKLWSSVERIWSVEKAKLDHELEEKQKDIQKTETTIETMVKGFGEWCQDPKFVNADKNGKALYVLGNCLLSIAGSPFIFCLGKNGYYEDSCVATSQLPAKLDKSHLRTLVRYVNENGNTIDIKDIRTPHETIAYSIKGRGGIPGSYIENMGGKKPVLNLSLYSTNKSLKPIYNSEVNKWLRLMFGKNYSLAENWIAWSTSFEYPQAALSMETPPGIGKQMLVRGLCEMLETPTAANQDDLTGNWGYKLMESPFITINEGWPQSMQNEPSAIFRQLTGGDPMIVSRKFMPPTDVETHARILLTANNDELVKGLVKQKNSTTLDREAVLDRLLHVECNSDAAVYLKELGGRQYTAKPGSAWVGGSINSSFIVAQHFLWLTENKKKPMGNNRLCVMGNGVKYLHDRMLMAQGTNPDVIEAVLNILKLSHTKYLVVVSGDQVYALPTGVVSWFREQGSPSARNITLDQCRKSLMQLCDKMPHKPFKLPSPHEALGIRKWYRLDTSLLFNYANHYGFKTEILMDIINNQENDPFNIKI